MLFYLHIPKTGGQTLALRLASAYLPTRVYVMKNDFNHPQGVDAIRNLAKTMDFTEGHVAGPVLSSQQGLRILTTVRDPIEQIISTYRHLRREPTHHLHRPASELGFEFFFDTFGDQFLNVQTIYLVRSFYTPTLLELMNDYRLWLMKNMTDAIDRLHWFVPCERINEFITLWSIEEDRLISHPNITVNVSDQSKLDVTGLRSYLHTRTDLYDLDMLLWNSARAWFERYRERIVTQRASGAPAANATRAFFQDGSGVWLTKGWHLATIRSDNVIEWWAGPSRFSEIKVKRSEGETFLEFEVVCVLGFHPNDLVFFLKNCGRRLDKLVGPLGKDGFFRVSLDVSGLSCEETIVVLVPQVRSTIQLSRTGDDATRRSFATQDWCLRTSSSLDRLVAPVRASEPA